MSGHRRRNEMHDENGQASVEMLFVIPLALALGAILLQLLLSIASIQAAQAAANAGARAASLEGEGNHGRGTAAANAAIPSYLSGRASVSGSASDGEARFTVTVDTPVVFPPMGSSRASRVAVFPLKDFG